MGAYGSEVLRFEGYEESCNFKANPLVCSYLVTRQL